MSEVEVRVKRLIGDVTLPSRATKGSAFYDISAREDTLLKRNLVTSVSTGLAFGVPPRYEMEIRPRSGLSLHKILLANSPGTLDSDYRGELKILAAELRNEKVIDFLYHQAKIEKAKVLKIQKQARRVK